MRAAWRWRARQAALKAGQGAASGLVASVAHGNEVRPRSVARQGTTGLFGRHGDDGGTSPSAWRGVRVNGQGVSGEARQHGGSEAVRPRQRRSERTRAQVPARAQSREGREKESGERKENVNGLTQSKLKICN